MDWRRPRLPPSLSSKTLLWRRCEARQRETLPSLERWKFGKGKWESWEVGKLGSGKVGKWESWFASFYIVVKKRKKI